MKEEAEFDAMLKGALAPPERPADRAFTLRIDSAVTEAERYRMSRRRLFSQMASEGLAVVALAGALAMLARVPALREALGSAPELAWIATLSLFLIWLLIRARPGTLA